MKTIRLIDAEIAYDKIAEQETSYYMDMEGVQAGIDETPTVDAVEVVRCRNCKWFQDERNEFTGSDGFCPNVAHGVSVDWFCADGEGKE